MSTQYDKIGVLYNDMKSLPASKLERANAHDAVKPFIKDAKVLDLACGTGAYSRALLSWGAKEVVGVDISTKMIEVARAGLQHAPLEKGQQYTFLVGDVSEPMSIEQGPFDVVFGAWLLNYAPDLEAMTGMFQNIANNLRAGGHFVGVTPYPSSNPSSLYGDKDKQAHLGYKYGVTVQPTGDVRGGLSMHVTGNIHPKPVEFDAFHLRKEVFEESARKAGMQGEIIWKEVYFPDEGQEAQQISQGIAPGYWDDYLEAPHFGICVVAR